MREVEPFVGADQLLPLLDCGVPREASLDLQRVQVDVGRAGRVLSLEGARLDQLHVVLLSQADVQDALLIGKTVRDCSGGKFLQMVGKHRVDFL